MGRRVTLVLLIALVSVASSTACHRGLVLTVTNETDSPVTSLTVQYTGGTINVPSVPPGTTLREKLRPTGESHLEVAFDLEGRHVQKPLDVYFEPGYRETFRIAIAGEGDVVLLGEP